MRESEGKRKLYFHSFGKFFYLFTFNKFELRKEFFISTLIPSRIKRRVCFAYCCKRIHRIISKAASDITYHLFNRHFLFKKIFPKDRDVSFCLDKTQNAFNCRAFPCSVSSDKPGNMPLLHTKTCFAQCKFRIDFRQFFYFKRVHFYFLFPFLTWLTAFQSVSI